MISILFLWAKENTDTHYRQGMNEILALVIVAFFAERVESKVDFGKMKAEEIAEDNAKLTEFIFDGRHTFADVYSTFKSILQYGVKNLY